MQLTLSQNDSEVRVVIQIARRYQTLGKSYRVITPYDGQRNRLEQALKNDGLLWEDKCFNVDSFQGTPLYFVPRVFDKLVFYLGNEEEHIIVSLVRSEKVGFLKNLRRTNVLLTRCKQSMIICTSKAFLNRGEASKSLVGKLAAEYAREPGLWLSRKDILAGRF